MAQVKIFSEAYNTPESIDDLVARVNTFLLTLSPGDLVTIEYKFLESNYRTHTQNVLFATLLYGPDVVGGSTVGSSILDSISSPVQDLTGLRNVEIADRAEKQVRLVEDEGGLYRFDQQAVGVDTPPAGPIVPSDSPITGRWFKTSAAISSHNVLSGIQGGAAGDYQHLTAAELTAISDNSVHRTSDGTDHTFINQDVRVAATPQFAGLGLGGAPGASAICQMDSTTKGFLPPRMTPTQRDAIVSPATGLLVFNTTGNGYNFYTGANWRQLINTPVATLTVGGVAFATASSMIETDAANFFWDNTTKRFGVGTATPNATLDVTGNSPGNVGGFPAGALQITSPTDAVNASAVITGHNSYQGNKQLWYLGSSSSSNDNITLINRQNGNLALATNDTTRVTIQSTGNVEINEYIKLGSGAPVIKMKKLTGTAGAEGSTNDIVHELVREKVLGMEVWVTNTSGNRVPPVFTSLPEHEYDVFISATIVRIQLTTTNSADIAGGAITILLTYEN
ncbi:hypothetical protein LCGC14_0144980 [marine sediment metagenome]|uniref:Uncharacterized protein n=1 Tax=marine sediment metagenome TaxID=412755 RepID=A0A0F9XH70_9ZZZZ